MSPSPLLSSPRLPIHSCLSDLRSALHHSGIAVLAAPPGAGKTTVVPLDLLASDWLAGTRIVMLEPRRLAARAAARRMSFLLDREVGDTVGFRVRGESVIGEHTRIEVVTEGVLTRLLQEDPVLEQYGLVIFDEFHERNLHGDVGLALTLHARRLLRDDLRILVMSATLDVERVAGFLGNAPIIRSSGRTFPVDVRYTPPRAGQSPDRAAAGVIGRALREHEGDILVFLPGLSDISRVHNALNDGGGLQGVHVHSLHSSTPLEKQDAAIRPAPEGVRKVVLSTTIAETSLTIDGVRVVIDSGLTRVPRYSPRTGLTRLETVRVTRSSADQRAGRAGRTADGVCYRLWNEHEQHALLDRWLPEILDADLTPLQLDLAAAGVGDAGELEWLDAPPASALAAARELLRQLGAIDDSGRITNHGTEMNKLGLHPRLAHMILRSRELGLAGLACDVAALLEERDVLRSESGGGDADLRTRVHLLHRRRRGGAGGSVDRAIGAQADTATLDRVLREADRLRRVTRAAAGGADERATGLPLAFAYPDRIARRRDPVAGRFLLRNGTGAVLSGAQELSTHEFIVVADLDGRRPESRIWRAAPVDAEDLRRHFADQIEIEERHAWDEDANTVRLFRREKLGAIVLAESATLPADPAETARLLAGKLVETRLTRIPWTRTARSLQQRISFLRHHDREWPDVSDAALLATAESWLVPRLAGMRGFADVKSLDMSAVLLELIGWRLRSALDELAPSHFAAPSGSNIPVDYSDPEAPMLSVRLQELFGLAETPRVLRGQVPLTVQLLSPAHRPVQVTRDLEGFWRSSYQEVRKELRGRYPRHHWPENPMTAPATSRAKPRGRT